MLAVSLVTLGSPDQLTGGYLYHRRVADRAPANDARMEFLPARRFHNPLASACDIVVVDSIAAATVAPWALRRGGRRPLAAMIHQPPGGIDHGRVRRAAQARLDRALYHRCAVLMVASASLRDELVAGHGLPPDRLRVVPPGCDPARASGPPRDLRAGRGAAFLSVGNWMARKGTLELLDAFARVPDVAMLHLVGRDDVEPEYTARIRRRLRTAELRGRVVVHGPLPADAVARLYAGADVFVLPSRREPYGTVYGEALAAGLPVVGWRLGNLPHLAVDGREGVVLDPGDIAGLSEALRRLALDEQWRASLAAAARRRGASLPTWDDTATMFFDGVRGVVTAAGQQAGDHRA
jgi:glycosyltransferase involved in cell wall biosynthesis